MTAKRILVGNLYTNCYLLCFSDRVAVIDPGGSTEKILKFCGDLPITDILLTHAHLDHTAAMGDLCDRFSPRVWMHAGDLGHLNDDYFRAPASPAEPHWRYDYAITNPISHGDQIRLGEGDEAVTLTVLHTPGHTPGSVCLHNEVEKTLFSGDTLFKGTYGRTDFPGSDGEAMTKSLQFLSGLPADTAVYPGHGFSTNIGDESWMTGGAL